MQGVKDWFSQKMQDPSTEKYFIVAIAGIILLSLTIAVWTSFGSGGGPAAAATGPVGFHCMQCSHEFGMPRDEYNNLLAQQGDGEVRAPCPQCNRGPAVEMFWCPACSRYYMPDWRKRPGGTGERICTHCGTNLRDWTREKYGR